MDKFFQIIHRVLTHRSDISDIQYDADMDCLYFNGGPTFFQEECVLSSCTKSECRYLLSEFCSRKYSRGGWNVNTELAKLLSQKGQMVAELAEDLIFPYRGDRCVHSYLQLAYLGCDVKWEKSCLEFLELCGDDGRDGIFLACYRLNTPAIYGTLVQHFTRWIVQPQWGSGTGEDGALAEFLTKWDRTPGYNIHADLRKQFDDFLLHKRQTDDVG